MSKPRKSGGDSVSLFPFMSILAGLIGILTLVISVSIQIKPIETEGLTEEEKTLAMEKRELEHKAETIEAAIREAVEKLKEGGEAATQLAELENRKSSLQAELDALQPAAAPDTRENAAERLREQIAAAKSARDPLTKKLEELKAELAARRNPPEKVESVVVRREAGGRLASRLMFVECDAKGLVLIDESGGKKRVDASGIGGSADFKAFLESAKNTRDSMVLFLIRKDGADTFTKAAHLAETQYEVRTGKLPIPNNGDIDLNFFRR